ncbi:hypothetical protein [Tautonia plasticadhaerens]|uniref:Uncharacterized protein n=1 Tax=Tautonia plasticadhaerens TaxID=2527974 RepID=A0A518GZL1_9BACT|nr:hypothetical protein [Tautonia plasticadhaerens]QDV34013.1 hypothetical protein ElP_18940 [Tautonia plasticadhaerens]
MSADAVAAAAVPAPSPAATRERLLAAKPPAPEPLKLPRGLGVVHVRALTARERAEWELAVTRDRKATRELLVVLTACDAAGTPLFTPEDLAALAGLDSAVVDAIFARALKLSRISQADVDELEGN